MNPNPWSSIVGFSGKSAVPNGAITEMTVHAVPVLGDVSASQSNTWKYLWFSNLVGGTVSADSATYAMDVPSQYETLTVTSGTIPVIDSIETYGDGTVGCARIIVTYKNTTPTSIDYDFGGSTGITSQTLSFTNADDYLSSITYSTDSVSGGLALTFISSGGSE